MDGIQELTGVTIVAATNRPDVIVRMDYILISTRLVIKWYTGFRLDAAWPLRSDPIRRTT